MLSRGREIGVRPSGQAASPCGGDTEDRIVTDSGHFRVDPRQVLAYREYSFGKTILILVLFEQSIGGRPAMERCGPITKMHCVGSDAFGD